MITGTVVTPSCNLSILGAAQWPSEVSMSDQVLDCERDRHELFVFNDWDIAC